ncbi:PAS domain S-box protein [Mycoplasmatota bacterium]|nr:PAS domain S-box protein [Mycoplasmatota bacterium]
MLFDKINNLPISFYILENERIIDCNLNCVNLFGYDHKEELIGLKPTNLSPYVQDDGKESLIKGSDYIKKAYSEKHVNFSWRHSKKNGDTFLAYINLISMKNIIFVLITNLDEIKVLDTAIKDRDKMYKLLFEENINAVYLVDVKTTQIIDANEAALQFYGYDLETFKNKKFTDISLFEDEEIYKNIELVLTHKRHFFYCKHKLANGEINDIECNCFSTTINGQDYMFIMAHDTTEKMKQNQIINTFITQSPYPIAVLDNTQRVININDKFSDLFLYTKEEVLGENLNNLLTTIEYRDEYKSHMDMVFNTNFVHVKTLRKRKDNSLINVEIVAFPITYNDKIIGAYVHYIDITHKIKANNQLNLFKKILENNNEGIIITDADGHIEWVNHAFTNITGFTLNEIMGNTPRILKSNLQSKEFYKNMWKHILNNNHWHGEIWNKNKKGEIYPEWLNINAIKNNQITTNYVGIFKDLSERKIIDQKMRILAQKDALTGLYNRVYFTENLNRIIQKEKKETSAVLFIDLNRFKDINDSLGHYAGDQFLIELSNRFQKYFNGNNLIARYGGDEFVILLKDCKGKQHITRHAKKILSIINKPFIFEGNYINTSASLGIAIYPKDGTNSDELIQNADIAMYEAKNHLEKKIFYYSPKMRESIDERFKIANLLRSAIENKAYNLMYEPVYDVYTNKVIAADMMIKWTNSQLNAYSKQKYIQVAIQTGLINSIFYSLFDDIAAKLSTLTSFNLPISLNISIEQLEQTQFISHIKETLNKYKLNPSNIEFEFTGYHMKDFSNRINKNFNDLLKMGFNFTLDNFGQDSACLAQIKKYHIRKIKLDKSLIKNIDNDTFNYELIQLYRIVSKEMNILLIAKGVNLEKQVNSIKNLQIDGGQGKYYSKPLTFNQLKKLLNEKS